MLLTLAISALVLLVAVLDVGARTSSDEAVSDRVEEAFYCGYTRGIAFVTDQLGGPKVFQAAGCAKFDHLQRSMKGKP